MIVTFFISTGPLLHTRLALLLGHKFQLGL